MGFLRGLRTFSTFGRGWSRRVAEIEAEAVAMYTRSASAVAAEVKPAKKAAGKDTAAATSSGGVGATGSFADLPDVAVYAVLAIAVVAIAIFVAKAAHNRRRAEAYAAKAEELSK